MTNRNGFLILVAALLSFAWSPALFAGDKSSQFGICYGLSVPDANNTGPYHVFGIRGASFIVPAFSLGGYFLASDHSGEPSASEKFRYTLTGIEAAYHIPNGQGDTFIAFRMGITKLRESPQPAGTDITFSPYHYGIATGYDYYLTNSLSVGFEGSYLHTLPGRGIINSVQTDIDSFNMINFMISFQIRL